MIVLTLYGIVTCIKLKCDLIYVPSYWSLGYSPYASLLPAFIVSLICRRPFVVVFHHLARLHYPLQVSLIRHADCCIAVSQATANDVEKQFQQSAREILLSLKYHNLFWGDF